MSEIFIRREKLVGRITLNRPQALNAITYDMCKGIDQAILEWIPDNDIKLIIIDAIGDRAFCAGGDLQQMYRSGLEKNYRYGHDFWRMEYRLNAMISQSPKPIISFLQGFTMGGGVGIGCHGSHRIVNETSRIAMPECTVGLVPDVGGSYILSKNNNQLGEFLALTGARLNPSDAIDCHFADYFVPASQWDDLKGKLSSNGDIAIIDEFNCPPPNGNLTPQLREDISKFFNLPLPDVVDILKTEETPWSTNLQKKLSKNSPLSMMCAKELIKLQRGVNNIQEALDLEFRFTHRAAEYGDFIEGIRAQVIDKDYNPKWKHNSTDEVSSSEVDAMLAPLGDQSLDWKERP